MTMTFSEFFDMKTKVLTDPPAQGVQGITIKDDPVASPEKRGEPIVKKKAKGDVPIKGKPKPDGKIKGKLFKEAEEISTGEAEPFRDFNVDNASAPEMKANNQTSSGTEHNPDIEGLDPEEEKKGAIRTVKGAHMVYKRPAEDGTFEELWIYPMAGVKDEVEIRRAILAGTDIKPGQLSSDDGAQTHELWTAGNAQMVHIQGLPN